jgi:AcrR family transcriptional regulator
VAGYVSDEARLWYNSGMATRTDDRHQLKREESRARIIESALRLFARHGYDSTSIRMIAQDAGISQGLMYNYFASKEELLQAIFQQSLQDVRESFAAVAVGDPAVSPVERFVRATFDLLRDKQDFWRLSYGVRMQAAVLASLGDELHSWTQSIRSMIEEYLRVAGHPSPAIEAAILFALIDGVAQHYVLDPAHYPLDAVVETIVAEYGRQPNEAAMPIPHAASIRDRQPGDMS